MAEAAARGAAAEPGLRVRLLPAPQTMSGDVLAADGYVFATPETWARWQLPSVEVELRPSSSRHFDDQLRLAFRVGCFRVISAENLHGRASERLGHRNDA